MHSPFPRLDGWKFIRELGRGGFGCVYLAESEKYQTLFAIKAVECRDSLMDEAKRKEISSEADILKTVAHANVLKLYDYFFTDEYFFIIMEYCPGGTLFDMIKSRRLDKTAIQYYFKQIVSAIAFCHERGIAHRDLKPENILVDAHGRMKIGDWGTSIQNGSSRAECGTVAYAAPELRMGRRYDAPKADMWSLGVILYTVAAGNLPWKSNNERVIEEMAVAGQYDIPPSMDPEIADLVKKLIVVSPYHRLSAAEVLAHPLFNKDIDASQLKLMQRKLPVPHFANPPTSRNSMLAATQILSLAKPYDRRRLSHGSVVLAKGSTVNTGVSAGPKRLFL